MPLDDGRSCIEHAIVAQSREEIGGLVILDTHGNLVIHQLSDNAFNCSTMRGLPNRTVHCQAEHSYHDDHIVIRFLLFEISPSRSISLVLVDNKKYARIVALRIASSPSARVRSDAFGCETETLASDCKLTLLLHTYRLLHRDILA